MPPSRMPPWVPLVALAACEAGSPPAGALPPNPPTVPPVTSAPSVAAPGEGGGAPPALAPTSAAIAEDVADANAFTLQLLARTEPDASAVISGTSVRHAIGAAYFGAYGVTAREIASALSLDSDPELAARLARAELAAWQSARGGAALDIASRLWVATGFSIRPEFQRVADDAFGARAASVDYQKPELARSEINAWISDHTHGKIAELLPSGSVDPLTRLVITNAIWFKAGWQLPFPKDGTNDEPFFVTSNKTVKVPMMHLTDTFRFAAQDGVSVLELPYAESELSMLVVLPDDPKAGLAKVAASTTASVLDQWAGALSTARVAVALPRFTLRFGLPLRGPLRELGMKAAFTEAADFTGIAAAPSQGGDLYLSEVHHETYVSVDEAGTEAAAATGAVMRTTSLITGPTIEFRADRPFLFFIREAKEGRVLFAGRLLEPKP